MEEKIGRFPKEKSMSELIEEAQKEQVEMVRIPAEPSPLGLIVAALLVGFCIGVVGSTLFENFFGPHRRLRKEACERGYAEWITTNPATGDSEFQWIEPDENKQQDD